MTVVVLPPRKKLKASKLLSVAFHVILYKGESWNCRQQQRVGYPRKISSAL